MPKKEITVNSDQSWEDFVRDAKGIYDKYHYVTFKISTGRQRTLPQNAALHVYLGLLAKEMNDAGFELKMDLKMAGLEVIEVPWTMELCKERLWKPIQRTMIRKESTTQAERSQYTEVYDVLNRYTAERFGISIPWPCKEEK